MTTPPRFRFALVIEDAAKPGDVCAFTRLRHAMKRLLRSDAFRCISVVAVKAEPGQAAAVGGSNPAPG
jgi:hypothetical protein